MTVEEAYKIAVRGRHGKLTYCYDVGDSFAFYFEEGEGTPFVTVGKKDGEIKLLHIPPISNLKKIEDGAAIPVEQVVAKN